MNILSSTEPIDKILEQKTSANQKDKNIAHLLRFFQDMHL